jgi:hypothetical protein
MPQPRYTKEEHARIGTEHYKQKVRQQVEAGNKGKIVAIDIETGAFEMADNRLTAVDRLLARIPDAQIWMVRIGYPAVVQFRTPFHFGGQRRHLAKSDNLE